MTQTVLYHNPNCSKSRAALALLQAENIPFLIREYLQDPLNPAEIAQLLGLLKLAPSALIRMNEPILKTKGINLSDLNDEALIDLCATYPVLLHHGSACIGRPIENIVRLLSSGLDLDAVDP
jgi:arsenate reductase (glutaredoxin)